MDNAGRRRAAMFVFRPSRHPDFMQARREKFFDNFSLNNLPKKRRSQPKPDAPMKMRSRRNYFSFKMLIASAASFCTAKSG
jgi:hypothetical protein